MPPSVEIRLTSRPIDHHVMEALALTFFKDERPLRGATGLVDWRLCGLLSRLILQGKITGAFGETLFLSCRRTFLPTKIILLGLGTSGEFSDSKVESSFTWLLNVVLKMGISEVAFSLPGVSLCEIDRRKSAQYVLEGIYSVSRLLGKEPSTVKLTVVEEERRMGELKQGFVHLRERMKGTMEVTIIRT